MDERLRELQRRFRASGDIEDEVAFLGELVRTERISRGRLGCAAALGHVAARRVLGDDAPMPPEGPDDLRRVLVGLGWGGKEAAIRAGLSIARRFLPHCGPRARFTPAAKEAVDAVESWLEEPSAEGVARCARAAGALDQASLKSRASAWAAQPIRVVAETAGWEPRGNESVVEVNRLDADGEVAETRVTVSPEAASHLRQLADYTRESLASATVGGARRAPPPTLAELVDLVRDSVLPWALGPAGATPSE